MKQTTCSHRFIYIETVINDRQITWWESDVHSEYRLDVVSVLVYEIANHVPAILYSISISTRDYGFGDGPWSLYASVHWIICRNYEIIAISSRRSILVVPSFQRLPSA